MSWRCFGGGAGGGGRESAGDGEEDHVLRAPRTLAHLLGPLRAYRPTFGFSSAIPFIPIHTTFPLNIL